jgi:hypothetical protein
MRPVAEVDNSVNVPAAVKAAAARADEYFKTAEAAAETEVTPEVTPEAPPVEAPIARETAPQPDEQTWEHRYKSMKGRYDRAENQVRQLSDRTTELERMISTLQIQQTPAERAPPSYQKLITEEEERDYGSEFLNVVGKKAKEELGSDVNALRQQMADMEARLNGVSTNIVQDARTKMTSTLDSQCPSWGQINDDQNFIAWLRLPDTYSGAIRHELLKAAWERNDTPRVLAFFKGFLSEEAATDPAYDPDETTAAPTPVKVPLENFAAPGRAKTAAASAPAEKPFFTRAQISKFYVDSASGKFRGRDADKEKLERQIFEATREGRIR